MVPTELPRLLWSRTKKDITMATQLKIGERQAMVMQDYQTIGALLSEAFGGSSEPKDETPQTFEQATAALSAVLGR